MKKFLFVVILLFLNGLTLCAQLKTLTVTNGYGSGTYQVGDTVHIWSVAYDNTQTFSTWTGDVQTVAHPNEWHTTIVMPNQNVNVSAQIVSMPSYAIQYEQIQGANTLKNVYSYFPVNPKGILYLFHGTSGSASNWISTVEYRSFVNRAIADTFGIIVTEAEEITLNTDLNGDGKLRWQGFPMDTVNGIDYQNIQIITDTMLNRGNFSTSTPKFSVGMSNGGSFSAAISHALNLKAGVSYCASSAQALFEIRTVPFAFRMAKFDDNEEVGPQGNYEAWQNDSILAVRSICHDYKIHDKQPIYPERFARISGVSVSTSQAIFNELLAHGELTSQHFALYSDSIKSHVLANPIQYPTIVTQTTAVMVEILNQIAASNAEHKFYSDYNAATLDFISNLCQNSVGLNQIDDDNFSTEVFPNPTQNSLNINSKFPHQTLSIYDCFGRELAHFLANESTTKINLTQFDEGMYVLKVEYTDGKMSLHRFIKKD
jgi:hypothetical protein